MPRLYEFLPEATDFTDIPVKSKSEHMDSPVLCPKCKGHGRWNLLLNQYGPGQHFQQGCGQCNGWGWVVKGTEDETCIHEFKEIGYEECQRLGVKHWGACWHVYKCRKCGRITSHDSSD